MGRRTLAIADRQERIASRLGHLTRTRYGSAGLGILGGLFLVALFAAWIAPFDPLKQVGTSLLPPSLDHLMGTDNIGRDLLSLVIYGSRASLAIGISAALAALLVGGTVGIVAGYWRGAAEAVLMRVAELFQTLPVIIVVLFAIAMFGSSFWLLITAVALAIWPLEARVIYGQFVNLREREFVAAAIVADLPTSHIILREILPNALPPVIVQVALDASSGDPDRVRPGFPGTVGSEHDQLGTIAVHRSGLSGHRLVDERVSRCGDLPGGDRLQPAGGWAERGCQSARRPRHHWVAGMITPAPLLEVRGLKVHLRVGGTVVRAVDGVDLMVNRGECVGIVGESGSGKSTLARAIVRLLSNVDLAELSGDVLFDGVDVGAMTEPALRRLRCAGSFSMIFQDPLGYLNPTRRVGLQVAEALRARPGRRNAKSRVHDLLREAGLPEPALVARRYPHELSGGMRQRVLIAIALALEPLLLMADEPTTSLDATVQLQVLETLRRLHRERDMALAIITHDLGLVAELCDRVYVMQAGKMVECADVFSLFEAPRHPYTAKLIGLSRREGRAAP